MQRTEHALVVAALTMTLSVVSAGEEAPTTRSVSEHYLRLDSQQRYDDLLDVYAPDAVFFDPTADVFQGPISKGPITGAEAIIAEQKRWGLAEQAFAVQGSFAVGDLVLHHGVITVRYQGADQKHPIPFVTVHRVSDGRIAERTDFGEYIKSLGLGSRFDGNTAATGDIAARYLRAYLAMDLEAQAALCAPGVVFQDPTAALFGKDAGLPIAGRDILMQRRQGTFAQVSDFGLAVERSFVANHHAVFIGTVTYTVGGRRWAQPAVFVIEVRDGLVTRHWDYVDYSAG